MVKNSRFRYKDTVDKGFGIFQRSDTDCILNVGYNTNKKKNKNKKSEMHLKADTLTEYINHYIHQPTLIYKQLPTT